MCAVGITGMENPIAPPTVFMRRVLDAAVQEYTGTVREQCAVELKKLAHLQKMWALRKPILDAHILSLQEKVQVLEQEIDEIVMEKIIHQT